MSRALDSVNVAFKLFLLVGAATGWFLARFETLPYYKLLNFSGLIMELIGIALLSSVILILNESQKTRLSDYVARYFVIGGTCLPASVAFGALSSAFYGPGSIKEVFFFSVVLALVLLIPCRLVFGSPVLEPLLGEKFEADISIKILGTTFLVLGFFLQVVASVGDILSGM
jgi:hypothetical protein